MRVLNFLFDDRYGGAPKRVIQVAGVLALKSGVKTTVCLPEGTGNVADIAREAGLPVRRLPFERIPRPQDVRKVLLWVLRFPRDVLRFRELIRQERPDLMHVNGAFFVSPAIAAKLTRVPLVWHLNDTILPKTVAPLFGAVVQVMADRVVVAAEAVAQHYGVSFRSYTVIHAPVDVEQFRVAERDRREPGGRFRVGILANWNPLKGLEYFLRAMALVRKRLGDKLEIVMVGARLSSQEDYVRRVEALIDELGLRDAILDHGFVVSVAPVLKELDVLVMSSTSEASSMPVLEGMASGLPVVATDVGGVRELVLSDPKRPAGKVVPSRDPEALALAVLDLLDHPAKAAQIGRNGRKLTEEQFCLNICAERHLEVYSELTGKPVDKG